MPYTYATYKRDLAWGFGKIKPPVKRGALSPIRAALFKKAKYKTELGWYLCMLFSIFAYCVWVVICTLRLAVRT